MKTKKFTLMIAILMMGAVIGANGQTERGRRSGTHEGNSRSEVRSDARDESQKDLNTRNNGSINETVRPQGDLRTQANPVFQRETSLPGQQEESPQRNSGEDRRSNSVNRSSGQNPVNIQESQINRDSRSDNPGIHEKPANLPDEGKNNRRNERYNGTPVHPGNGRNDQGYSDTRNNNVNHEGYKRDGNGEQREFSGNRNYRDYPNPGHRENYRKAWDHKEYNRYEWEHRNYNWDKHHWEFSHYYVNGHIPWYFRNNLNYWFYPEYGHILRGFRYEPYIFYSGMIPYYFYDGFFYRYYPGIGYVWIEEPSDIWFNELPHLAVRVRVGGHIYFRFGNAYFRAGHLGFRLVILPERYYDRASTVEIMARF